jgi:hypothetical protein
VVAYDPIEWESTVIGVSENAAGQLSLEIAGGLPPYSVLWSNGEQGIFIDDLSEGIYSAVIADAAGCSVATEELWVPMSMEENGSRYALMYDSSVGLRNLSPRRCEIQIIDSNGRIIIRDSIAPGASFSCGQLAQGYYLAICNQQVLPFAIQR